MIGFDNLGMGMGGLGMLLFWVAFIIVIALLLRLFLGEMGGRKKGTALDLLDERYARGEIDREEYLRRRADLESSG